MTNIEVIDKLVPLYEEVLGLADDVKEILDDAKDKGLPHTNLAKIAKAKAASKLGDLVTNTQALQKILNEVT